MGDEGESKTEEHAPSSSTQHVHEDEHAPGGGSSSARESLKALIKEQERFGAILGHGLMFGLHSRPAKEEMSKVVDEDSGNEMFTPSSNYHTRFMGYNRAKRSALEIDDDDKLATLAKILRGRVADGKHASPNDIWDDEMPWGGSDSEEEPDFERGFGYPGDDDGPNSFDENYLNPFDSPFDMNDGVESPHHPHGSEALPPYPEETEPRQKRYGFLLSKGFSFGRKRFDSPPHNHRFGWRLGSGFALGKRSGPLDFAVRPRFSGSGMVLGRGYMFGKRGVKRYGWVLGGGRSFGKRSSGQHDSVDVKYFIDDDGDVYRLDDEDALEHFEMNENAGENSHGDGDAPFEDYQAVPDKRYGFVLGRGFAFGKRGRSFKRYGHIIGSGYMFGK